MLNIHSCPDFPSARNPVNILAVHELEATDNISGVLKIVGNYGVMLVAFAIFHFSLWLYPLVWVLMGSRFRALENLTHEASHRQLFRNSFLNNWMASLFCAFVTHSSLWNYRKSHQEHHLYLGDPGRDPDLAKYGQLPLPHSQKVKQLLAVFTGTYDLKTNLMDFLRCFIHPASVTELLVRLLFWLVLFSLLTISNGWWDFLWLYVVPFLTSYRAIRQLVDMSEHILDSEVPCHTRNVLCNPILRFLLYPHGDYLHLLHHMYPAIPGNKLWKAHQFLQSEPEYTKISPFNSYFFGKDSVLSSAFK